MKDFFISYNKNDLRWAEWIAWILEEAGFTVNIQAWDFKPGEDFVQRMNESLDESRKLIAVLSQDYFDAKYTIVEWEHFFRKDPIGRERRLLPIRVKECQLPPLLEPRIYIDLLGLTEEDARIAILMAAKGNRGRPLSPLEFPGRGLHKRYDAEQNSPQVESYPGEAQAPAAPNHGWNLMPDLGPIISKSCDRDEQEETFDRAFREVVKRRIGCPQMYVVHGPMRERHSSLVERWRETLIQKYADHLSGQSKAAVIFWEIEKWPASGNVVTDLNRLIERLFEKCYQRYLFEPHDYSPLAFRELVLPLKKQVIVVQHEIDAEKWRPDTPQLIEEYLRFWEAVKGDAVIPQFLIFLNVEYPASRIENPWKVWNTVRRLHRARYNRQIAGALTQIGKPGHQMTTDCDDIHCFYTPLKELSCIKLKDVVAWFKKYRLGKNEVVWETQSRNIFRLKGWKFNESKNMADIENALDEFIAAAVGSIGVAPRAGSNQ